MVPHSFIVYRMRGRSASGAVVAVLALALLVSACGSSDTASKQADQQAQLAAARADGARTARQDERLRQLEQQVREKKSGGSGTSTPSSPPPSVPSQETPCPGTTDLTVGPSTSCAFAQNVRDSYNASGAAGGANNFQVFSPTTNQTYSMFCTGGTPHRCTGGNNASVTFP